MNRPDRTVLPVLWVVAVCLSLALGQPAAQVWSAEHAGWNAALGSITTNELHHHVEVLASDTMEGREAGTRGGHAAGGYLLQFAQQWGLEGGADDGSYYQPFGNGYRNILVRMSGSDPELSRQLVVIGAHYDHVGYGSRRNSFGPIGYIHNGADDNASGTSALVEVAEAFTRLPRRPRRTVLFAWWDGEEKGLLGSKYWMSHHDMAALPIVFGLNLDMVGRLRHQRLEVYGARSGADLRRLVSAQNTSDPLLLDFRWKLEANSDHYTFHQHQIPYLMFHTGLHENYHRPSDDVETLNFDGMQQISRLLFRVAAEIAEADSLPTFRPEIARESQFQRKMLEQPIGADPPRLGISWREERAETGVRLVIQSVDSRSPAAVAGLAVEDRIIRFAGREITSAAQFQQVVLAAPSATDMDIRRAGLEQPLTLPVQLRGNPVRVGISWREDPGQPSLVVVSQVIPGSVAAVAGLQTADRIYEVGGTGIRSGEEFRRLVTQPASSLELLVERSGRLETRELRFLSDDRPASGGTE